MRKYPFIKQKGLKDCGPACVLMILKYYGGNVRMDRLLKILSVDKNGTKAYHIVHALREFGFNSDGYKYDSISCIKLPAIVHINLHSYYHYAVIWKVNKKYVLLGDPSVGNIKMEISQFLSLWTGVVIEAYPNGVIIKEEEVNVYKYLYKFIKPKLKTLLLISFLSVLLSVLSICTSFFIQAVNTYINNHGLLINIFTIFCFIFILKIIISYIRNKLLIKFDIYFDKALSLDTFKNIISLPYESHSNKVSGEMVSYFNDLSLIKSFVVKTFISLFMDIPLFIILSVYLFYISRHFFMICMFICSLHFILWMIYKDKTYYLSSDVLRKKAVVNSFITESISGIETVKNIYLDDKILDRFKKDYFSYISSRFKFENTGLMKLLYTDLIGSLSILLVCFYGTYNINSSLLFDEFITLYLLFNLLTSSFLNIIENNYDFAEVKSAIYHIGDISLNKKEKYKANGRIKIKNLYYSFDGINDVLKNINLDIIPSSKIIVSGDSGSGKSTLFKIIKGYYENYRGEVLIDNKQVNNFFPLEINYVSLRETIFTGRLYNDVNISDLKDLNICEIDFPIKDKIVYENGYNLSDGQRQRISLLRALGNFNILIIDEGLSEIDINMERRILKKLIEKYYDKTIIFITHRIDNIDLFDRFIKLEKGKIVLDLIKCDFKERGLYET